MLALVSGGLLALTGCPEDPTEPRMVPEERQEGPMERAGRTLDELGEEAGRELEQLGDRIEEHTDRLGDDDPQLEGARADDRATTRDADPQLADAQGIARELPALSLQDPLGTKHDVRQVAEQGLVLVVTAATQAQGDAQEGWNEQLLATMPSGGPRLVLLEDLGPGLFDDTARERMREEYDPHRPPLLLIDPQGQARRALGVEEDTTVVLAYRPDLKLARVERGEASRERAERLWASLQGEGRSP